jgi:hypothetical protein
MLGVGGTWHLSRLQIELDCACQHESSGTNLGKRWMERRVLAQRNDEALSVLDAIESGNESAFRPHREKDDLQNETVSRGLVLQMASEHLNRLDGSKATSQAVKVVVVVTKRQAVDVDVGSASSNSALKQ